jgi:hypothetical protein
VEVSLLQRLFGSDGRDAAPCAFKILKALKMWITLFMKKSSARESFRGALHRGGMMTCAVPVVTVAVAVIIVK